jgi:GNAT superfamily N-acetyltransferase
MTTAGSPSRARPDTPLLRWARPADGAAFVALVRALAAFAGLAPPDAAAAERLLADAFGPRPRYELLVAELDGEVVAYAAFFETYSTFRAQPSLYLEDLFVAPAARGRGVGSSLLSHLGRLAVERGCGRFEWSVDDWNERARRFYLALGAHIGHECQLCRVEGDALLALARRAPGAAAPRSDG